MQQLAKHALALTAALAATQAGAALSLYEDARFEGRSATLQHAAADFRDFRFNDRVSSVVVSGGPWQLCRDTAFQDGCIVLQPGHYPSLSQMRLNDRLSSARPLHPVQARPAPAYRWPQQRGQRLYEVPVDHVQAVHVRAREQCWLEQRPAAPDRDRQVAGAVIGGVLGGLIGHQVGSGSGRDVMTVGGAVAGAALGAHIGRSGSDAPSRTVQRCAAAPGRQAPDHYLVSYRFRGEQHHVRMAHRPGRTVTVDRNGRLHT